MIPIAGALVVSQASSATFNEPFLNSVAGLPGADPIERAQLLAPNQFEVLDRIAPNGGGAYPASSGTPPTGLPADSPAQPRRLSNTLSVPENVTPDAVPLSNLAVAMFQLMASHEIARSPTNPAEPIPLPVPSDDPIFNDPIDMDRSQTTGGATREQLNDITSAFDGSTVYGSTQARQEMLWETDAGGDPTGFLKTSHTPGFEGTDTDLTDLPGLPQFDVDPGPAERFRPMAGDVRADENPTLQALHQLFMLEHNRVAQEIFDGCSDAGLSCSGEQVFYAAKSVVAKTQEKIFYDELLPVFLGTDDFESLLPDESLIGEVEGAINSFTAAAGRVGHTQVPDTILLATTSSGVTGEVPLSNCFFDRGCLGGASLEEILYGAAVQNAEPIDLSVVDSLRNAQSPGFGAPRNIDLLATNINRGRDHEIPDYLTLREQLGFSVPTTIAELLGLLPASVLEAYGILTDADLALISIDALVGIFGETRGIGDYLGETGKALWVLQFLGLQNGLTPTVFPTTASQFAVSIFQTDPISDPLAEYFDSITMASILANNLGGTPGDYGNVFIGTVPAAVPVPPALSLVLSGTLALFALRRRRRS